MKLKFRNARTESYSAGVTPMLIPGSATGSTVATSPGCLRTLAVPASTSEGSISRRSGPHTVFGVTEARLASRRRFILLCLVAMVFIVGMPLVVPMMFSRAVQVVDRFTATANRLFTRGNYDFSAGVEAGREAKPFSLFRAMFRSFGKSKMNATGSSFSGNQEEENETLEAFAHRNYEAHDIGGNGASSTHGHIRLEQEKNVVPDSRSTHSEDEAHTKYLDSKHPEQAVQDDYVVAKATTPSSPISPGNEQVRNEHVFARTNDENNMAKDEKYPSPGSRGPEPLATKLKHLADAKGVTQATNPAGFVGTTENYGRLADSTVQKPGGLGENRHPTGDSVRHGQPVYVESSRESFLDRSRTNNIASAEPPGVSGTAVQAPGPAMESLSGDSDRIERGIHPMDHVAYLSDLWRKHASVHGDRLKMATTFENRLNAEVSPVLARRPESLWHRTTFPCGGIPQAHFLLSQSPKLEAELEIATVCAGAGTCVLTPKISDFRGVEVGIGNANDASHYVRIVTAGNVEQHKWGPLRGKLRMRLVDSAVLAIRKSCPNPKAVTVRIITVGEIRQLLRLHHATQQGINVSKAVMSSLPVAPEEKAFDYQADPIHHISNAQEASQHNVNSKHRST